MSMIEQMMKMSNDDTGTGGLMGAMESMSKLGDSTEAMAKAALAILAESQANRERIDAAIEATNRQTAAIERLEVKLDSIGDKFDGLANGGGMIGKFLKGA